MGIFIHLAISSSVTQKEWEKVYQETLLLVKAFPFAERRKVLIRGIPTMCAVPTEERERRWGWNNEKTERGWFADCDYVTLIGAEDYFLPRVLDTDDIIATGGTEDADKADVSDAMLVEIPTYLEKYDWKDPRFNCRYHLWGAKTQGEPYHMYLLSVACLIESRLGNKAFVYGDITKGQCEKAVRMANEHLTEKIHIPDRCDPDRLFERIETGRAPVPLTDTEKMKLFINLYLGKQDAEFGRVIRTRFSEKASEEYWRDRFGHYRVPAIGFRDALRDYLLWGFDFEKMCSYIRFQDDDGSTYYEEFIKMVMDTKMHHRCKDCSDLVAINPDEERPYGISRLFAQFVFAGAMNKKIDRYIPVEEIRSALSRAIGSYCPVNELIDEYLEKEQTHEKQDLSGNIPDGDLSRAVEQDPSQALSEVLEARKADYEDRCEKYDIIDLKQLPYYEAGDKIDPVVMKVVGKSFSFYRGALAEDTYLELMRKESQERCEWLSSTNQNILLKDKDWEKIYDDIIEHPEAFARYYPMVRVRITSEGQHCMIRAFVANDELYSYAFELEKQYAEKPGCRD